MIKNHSVKMQWAPMFAWLVNLVQSIFCISKFSHVLTNATKVETDVETGPRVDVCEGSVGEVIRVLVRDPEHGGNKYLGGVIIGAIEGETPDEQMVNVKVYFRNIDHYRPAHKLGGIVERYPLDNASEYVGWARSSILTVNQLDIMHKPPTSKLPVMMLQPEQLLEEIKWLTRLPEEVCTIEDRKRRIGAESWLRGEGFNYLESLSEISPQFPMPRTLGDPVDWLGDSDKGIEWNWFTSIPDPARLPELLQERFEEHKIFRDLMVE